MSTMNKFLLCVFFNVCTLSCCLSWTLLDGDAYEFKDGDQIRLSFINDTTDITHRVILKSILMTPRSKLTFQLLDIPIYVSYVLTQVHSYKYNVTLSYDIDLLPSTYINGSNIGLVQPNTGMHPHNMQFFITNHNRITVMCLLAFEAYRDDDPVPGGCNQEFPTKIAPYLLISYNEAIVKVEMQNAAYTGFDDQCDMYPSPVELEVYHMYMQERDFSSQSYFDAIKKMLTVEGMMKSGTLMPAPPRGPPLRRIRSAYPGTGSVYGVIARSASGKVAAYVPAVTFACGHGINLYDDCEIFSMPLSEIFCVAMLWCGMFMCLCGHRKFLASSSIISFLWGTVITYMLLGINFGAGYGIDLLAVLIGFLFSVLWWFMWLLFGLPIIAAVSSTLALGFLITSAIMFAGLGSASWLVYNVNFWAVFICITMTIPVYFCAVMHIGNILACAIVGSYIFTAAVDHYVGSNLKYIFLNTMRRAIDSDFRLAAIDPPFELADLLMVLTWLVLAVAGTALQLYLQRGRPPFPPRAAWCLPPDPAPAAPDASAPGSRSLLMHAALLRLGSERTPLLVDAHAHGRGRADVEAPQETTPPARRRALAPPPVPDAGEQQASTEKLNQKLLAVLEPGPAK